MPFILLYILKFSLSLSLVYLFYRFVLRPLTFYQWNRCYLAIYSLLSFGIPFIDIAPWISKSELDSNVLLQAIPALGSTHGLANADYWWSSLINDKWRLALTVIAAGSFVMLCRAAYQFLSLQLIRRKAVLLESSDVKLYDVAADISPFSFARSIYINRRLHSEDELRKIVQHEFVHVRQNHTRDILLAELLIIACWFNPFAWMLRKAIRQNLEFIADDQVISAGQDLRQYQYLLLKVVGIPQYSITHNFNFSSLKKRIIMMNKMKTARVHLVKFLFVLPLLALSLIAFRQKKDLFTHTSESVDPALSAVVQDTLPKPPPPPPAPPSAFKAKQGKNNELVIDRVSPADPESQGGNVKRITISTQSTAVVNLKNGKKETYDLSQPDQKAKFEKKYGKLIPPPPPPVPPVEAVEPIPPVENVSPATPPRPENTVVEQVTTKVTISGTQPLIILDGIPLAVGVDISTIDVETIAEVNVLKDEKATSLYGKKGENGVIIINTKENQVIKETTASESATIKAKSINIKNGAFNGLVIINGKESNRESLDKLDPASIREVNILKGDAATTKYPGKGINGVMIITTK